MRRRVVACDGWMVTGGIITEDAAQVTRTRKTLDRIRRGKAEESVDWNYVPYVCDVPAYQPSQVRINVNVQAVRLEYRSGLFDFFRDQPRMLRAVLDRFTVEITADAPSGENPALIEEITALPPLATVFRPPMLMPVTTIARPTPAGPALPLWTSAS